MPHLEFNQFLPVSPTQAWDFFSNPSNLARITPAWMNFRITSEVPQKIYPGLIITYKVSPLWGIPVNWVTEITHAEEPIFFIDEQRAGPYAIWHHEHRFKEVDGGVLMTDKLFYRVPGGILGTLIDRAMVGKRIRGIFAFREQVIRQGGIL